MTRSTPFEAIIFDHDGTLIDTETADLLACQALYAEHGANLEQTHWAEIVVGLFGGYQIIFDELIALTGITLTHAQLQEQLRALWRIHLNDVALMPHVQTLIPSLHRAGYRLAVATASDQAWADRWLNHFALRSFFHVVATQDDVENNKPAPDVYLFAARQLQVEPANCLVFEDSVMGTRAAKAAGMTVIAVPSPITKSLDFSLADGLIDDLGVVSPTWLESLGRS